MAAPTLDGSATGTRSGSGPETVTLTTTQTNDLICVMSYVSSGTGGTPPDVTGITGGGLTFSLRKRAAVSGHGKLEFWTAVAPTALSAVALSIAFAGGFDDAAVVAWGVHGCNTVPFDSNASVPVEQSNSSTYTPTITGISTDLANDFLVYAASTNSNSTGSIASGFTSIGSAFNGGGSLFAVCTVAYKTVTVKQVNQTFAWGGNVAPGNIGLEVMFDALTADSATPPVTASGMFFG